MLNGKYAREIGLTIELSPSFNVVIDYLHIISFLFLSTRRYTCLRVIVIHFFLNIHPIFRPNFSYNSDIYIYIMIIKKRGNQRRKIKAEKKKGRMG